ncbi:class I SAM-dependent methyltransferase, partial [Candidatus Sumerlaeota bacterium]|nr:class I SAM-dependent methyltransferase [Candidatus Sumerlaeota bacterium]
GANLSAQQVAIIVEIDRLAGEVHALAQRQSKHSADVLRLLDAWLGEHHERLQTLVARIERQERNTDRVSGSLDEEVAMIERFTPFFDQGRGAEEAVREQQRMYVEEFAGKSAVIDLGCGRGEFLELLRDAGIAAEGVDRDETLVAACRERGLTVHRADLLDWLTGQPDASRDGIFCAQVVEHLPLPTVDRLVAHAARVLRPDGRLILETLNPTNLNIFMGPYWADPGHRQAIHPWVLTVICQTRGFMENRVVLSAPPPEDFRIQRAVLDGVPPEIRPALEHLDAMLSKVNDSLYGPGHFAVIARRARPEELVSG